MAVVRYKIIFEGKKVLSHRIQYVYLKENTRLPDRYLKKMMISKALILQCIPHFPLKSNRSRSVPCKLNQNSILIKLHKTHFNNYYEVISPFFFTEIIIQ